MPDNKDEGKKETSRWITIGGKKIEIPAGEAGEEAIREKLPSARGMKESNTKQSQKSIMKRFGIPKSLFKIREQVVFDDYNKSGIIAGFDGDLIKILGNDKRMYKSEKNNVFKSSELIGGLHWDSMTDSDRVNLLKSKNIPSEYFTRHWATLPNEIRLVLKETSPAGMTTSTTGTHNPVYNPINEEKPVSERLKEEIARQHKDKGGEYEDGEDTGDKDEKKGKD